MGCSVAVASKVHWKFLVANAVWLASVVGVPSPACRQLYRDSVFPTTDLRAWLYLPSF